MLSAALILQAREKKGQTRAGVRTGREGICTPCGNHFVFTNSLPQEDATSFRRPFLGPVFVLLESIHHFPDIVKRTYVLRACRSLVLRGLVLET